MRAETDPATGVQAGAMARGVSSLRSSTPRAEGDQERRAPDPEVVAKPTRRQFTAEYRLRILEEADRCTRPGEVGRLLRREGLYTSHLAAWRKARRSGSLQGLTPKKRGAKPAEHNPLSAKVRQLPKRPVPDQTAHPGRWPGAGRHQPSGAGRGNPYHRMRRSAAWSEARWCSIGVSQLVAKGPTATPDWYTKIYSSIRYGNVWFEEELKHIFHRFSSRGRREAEMLW